MAELDPKLDINFALVDADKVLAQMRELRDEARRSQFYATMLFIGTAIVGVGMLFFRWSC